MGVMPLPHIATLYVALDRVKLSACSPTVAELGRLHTTPAECRTLEKLERQRIRQMAFGIVTSAALPVVTSGKVAATKPRVAISKVGRLVFNSFVAKPWEAEKIDRCVILFDGETLRVAVVPFAEGATIGKQLDGATVFPVRVKDGQAAINASTDGRSFAGLLSALVKYDYKTAGNQAFDAEWNAKVKGFVISLPKETPVARPVITRVKAPKKTTNVTQMGSTTPVAGAPAETTEGDEELLSLEG